MFRIFKKKKKKDVEKTNPDLIKKAEKIERPIEEEKVTEVENEPVLQQEEVQEEKEEKKPQRKMPYHITKHSLGGWQIKRGKAQKALKRFETQKEAIEYAKVLEKEKGQSYVIHKADGTTRKKKY